MPRIRIGALALLVALSSGGCGGHGEFVITWSFSDGEITSAGDCSSRGVERVVITFENDQGGTVKQFVFNCGQASSRIRSVATGTYSVRVQAFGPAGLPFEDPATGEPALLEYLTDFQITDNGAVTEGTVVFTPNPPCADFVDNDGDGLVDAADPGCLDKNGDYDPDPNRGEEDEVGPGQLSLTWQINGGRDTCSEVQPAGATTTSVLVDGLETGRFDCADGTGTFSLSSGGHTVALQLLDESDDVLATTPTRDITVLQDLTTEEDFDVLPADFDPPQTGELEVGFWWITAGKGCNDASPVVAEQSLRLVDDNDQVVDATTLAGDPVDGTRGQCTDIQQSEALNLDLPVGTYTLTVVGYVPGAVACWQQLDEPLQVDIGPNPPYALVIPQTDASGLCAP